MECVASLLQLSHVSCWALQPSLPESVHLRLCWGLAPCWMVFLGLLVAGVEKCMWVASLSAAPLGAAEFGRNQVGGWVLLLGVEIWGSWPRAGIHSSGPFL